MSNQSKDLLPPSLSFLHSPALAILDLSLFLSFDDYSSHTRTLEKASRQARKSYQSFSQPKQQKRQHKKGKLVWILEYYYIFEFYQKHNYFLTSTLSQSLELIGPRRQGPSLLRRQTSNTARTFLIIKKLCDSSPLPAKEFLETTKYYLSTYFLDGKDTNSSISYLIRAQT